MMQGQGGKRGPNKRPRKRKKQTPVQKQRKAEMKKLNAQAQSKAAKKQFVQFMIGVAEPPVPSEGPAEDAVAGASAASATNVAANPAAGPAAASASEASAVAAAHDVPTTAHVTCNALSSLHPSPSLAPLHSPSLVPSCLYPTSRAATACCSALLPRTLELTRYFPLGILV